MSDSEFSTEAELSIHVPQRELKRVRDDIESELDTVGVGVTVENGRATRTDGGLSGSSMVGAGAIDELADQTDLLEDILDEIEDGGGGGGGLGGGGGGGGGGILPGGGGGGGGDILEILGIGAGTRIAAKGIGGAAGLVSRATPVLGTLLPALTLGSNQFFGTDFDWPGIEDDTITGAGSQMIDDIMSVGLGPGFSGPSFNDLTTTDQTRWEVPAWMTGGESGDGSRQLQMTRSTRAPGTPLYPPQYDTDMSFDQSGQLPGPGPTDEQLRQRKVMQLLRQGEISSDDIITSGSGRDANIRLKPGAAADLNWQQMEAMDDLTGVGTAMQPPQRPTQQSGPQPQDLIPGPSLQPGAITGSGGQQQSSGQLSVNVNAPISVEGGQAPSPDDVQQLKREFERVARGILETGDDLMGSSMLRNFRRTLSE